MAPAPRGEPLCTTALVPADIGQATDQLVSLDGIITATEWKGAAIVRPHFGAAHVLCNNTGVEGGGDERVVRPIYRFGLYRL